MFGLSDQTIHPLACWENFFSGIYRGGYNDLKWFCCSGPLSWGFFVAGQLPYFYFLPAGVDPWFPIMLIFIQNEETLEYLTETHHWSKNLMKGKQFLNIRLAYRAAKLEAIGAFNIVCYIPRTKEFINLHHGKGIGKSIKEEIDENES